MLRCTTPAHPRSRGENRSYQARRPSPGGSSPLTRGKRRGVHPHPGRCRLIPAHAGKTVRREPRRRHTEAHPRSRGENLQACVLSEDCHGSSPLTRGKHLAGLPVGLFRRLIPAHAGKTYSVSSPSSATTAHPRSRGENGQITSTRRPSAGSSPLTRGKLRWSAGNRRSSRLIPAHAGKTLLRAAR